MAKDVNDDQNFDDFFKEAASVGLEEKPVKEVVVEDAAAAKQVEEAKAAEEAAAAKRAEEEAAVKQAEATRQAEEAAKVAERESAAAAKQAEEEAKVKAAQPTEEELAAEKEFESNWPDHAARMKKQGEEINALKQMLSEAVAELRGQIDPVLQGAQAQIDREHEATILTAHKDAFDLIPKVDEWIAKQPKYLQPGYNWVMDHGTAAEVVEFYTMFKQATGITAAPEKVETKETKVHHLAPVDSRRSATVGAIDPNDFDTAFKEAAKAV